MENKETPLSRDEFRRLVKYPPKSEDEKSKIERVLLDHYRKSINLIKGSIRYSGTIVSEEFLKDQIHIAWSQHSHKERAATVALRLLRAADDAQRRLETLSELKEASRRKVKEDLDAVAPSNRPKSTAQALKAVASAYRRADATMSRRVRLVAEAAQVLSKLGPIDGSGDDKRWSGPWGGFAVRLPYGPDDKSGAQHAKKVVAKRAHATPLRMFDQYVEESVYKYKRKLAKLSD